MRPRDHEAARTTVATQAPAPSYATASQVHPSLLVSAVDLSWAFKNQQTVGEWTAYAARQIGWAADGNITGSALVTRIRELRSSIPGMAPLAIFPLAAQDIADLLMGHFDYIVTLRPDRLASDFRARGIALRMTTGADANKTFFKAERLGHTVTVSAHIREQMLRELFTVDTLVDIVDLHLRSIHSGGPAHPRTVFCDESNAWHRAPTYLGE